VTINLRQKIDFNKLGSKENQAVLLQILLNICKKALRSKGFYQIGKF
jgi:PAZ domain